LRKNIAQILQRGGRIKLRAAAPFLPRESL
jgi:hypothetical protein